MRPLLSWRGAFVVCVTVLVLGCIFHRIIVPEEPPGGPSEEWLDAICGSVWTSPEWAEKYKCHERDGGAERQEE